MCVQQLMGATVNPSIRRRRKSVAANNFTTTAANTTPRAATGGTAPARGGTSRSRRRSLPSAAPAPAAAAVAPTATVVPPVSGPASDGDILPARTFVPSNGVPTVWVPRGKSDSALALPSARAMTQPVPAVRSPAELAALAATRARGGAPISLPGNPRTSHAVAAPEPAPATTAAHRATAQADGDASGIARSRSSVTISSLQQWRQGEAQRARRSHSSSERPPDLSLDPGAVSDAAIQESGGGGGGSGGVVSHGPATPTRPRSSSASEAHDNTNVGGTGVDAATAHGMAPPFSGVATGSRPRAGTHGRTGAGYPLAAPQVTHLMAFLSSLPAPAVTPMLQQALHNLHECACSAFGTGSAAARPLQLADFRVLRRLGHRSTPRKHQAFYGANAAVYAAELRRTGAAFALKSMFTYVADAGEAVETPELDRRYQREWDVASRSDRLPRHPHLLPVLAHFADTPRPGDLPDWDVDPELSSPRTAFLVLPLLSRTLQDEITSRRARAFGGGVPVESGPSSGGTITPAVQPPVPCFPRATLLAFALQLAHGLNHLHARRIVHRDVKPDNILLDWRWSALLGGTTPLGASLGAGLTIPPRVSLLDTRGLGTGSQAGGSGSGGGFVAGQTTLPAWAGRPDGVVGDGRPALAFTDVGVDNIRLVLSDYGECLDCEAEDMAGFKMQYLYSHMGKGGAPAYYAPEVASAKPGRGAVVDYSCQDAWSLGMVLWHMVTPSRPFWSTSSPAKFRDDDRRRVPHPCADVRQLITGLLQVDPARRLSLADAVARLEVMLWFKPPRRVAGSPTGGSGAGAGPGAPLQWSRRMDAGWVRGRMTQLRRAIVCRLPLDPSLDLSVTVTESLALAFLASERASVDHVLRVASVIVASGS